MGSKLVLILYSDGRYCGCMESDTESALGRTGNDGMIRKLYDLSAEEMPGRKNRVVSRRGTKYTLYNPKDSSVVIDVGYFERTGLNSGITKLGSDASFMPQGA